MKLNVAHYREIDDTVQTIEDHLINVSNLSGELADKLNLKGIGKLCGILHDIGKYSNEFQCYIQSAVGLISKGDSRWVNSENLKGQIDHSTAGAQYVQDILTRNPVIAEFMSLVIASHHSGLIDVLSLTSDEILNKRLNKNVKLTHKDEAIQKLDETVETVVNAIIESEEDFDNFIKLLHEIHNKYGSSMISMFTFGQVARFLLSCLIDADRLDSANFEIKILNKFRNKPKYSWEHLIKIFDASAPKQATELDIVRQNISDECFKRSSDPTGLFRLTVPTGGGKTFSSLRFGLNHARTHNMKRIIFIIPYTSIIDQNAEVFKNLYGNIADDVVLEHHSNLIIEDNKKSWRNKVLSEDWDSPIVVTTMVQFLNALFDGSPRNVRRMHTLANSIIICDEIQTLPIKLVHMFNNSVNFLIDFCKSSVVLCTATQPLLHNVESKKGALSYNPNSEIVDYKLLFETLKRVTVVDRTKNGGWDIVEVANLITQRSKDNSVLYIANTKKMAKETFSILKHTLNDIYHLSTNMCPKHRKKILSEVVSRLKKGDKIVCISTQLIEAGVDVDFDWVIRSIAGIDSICQAAGRCNRNGLRPNGSVEIINPKTEYEKVKGLPDIKISQNITERILREFKESPKAFDGDIIGTKAIAKYYTYFFYRRATEMSYNTKIEDVDCNLLSLLSTNEKVVMGFKVLNNKNPTNKLIQSFKTAGDAFKVIDSASESVIVLFDQDVKNMVNRLQDDDLDIKEEIGIIKRLQPYHVNLFSKDLEFLRDEGAIHIINEESGIQYMDEEYYNMDHGVDIQNPRPIPILIE